MATLDPGVRSASCPCCFTPGQNPDTQYIRDWKGPTDVMNISEKRKTFHICIQRWIVLCMTQSLYQLYYLRHILEHTISDSLGVIHACSLIPQHPKNSTESMQGRKRFIFVYSNSSKVFYHFKYFVS
jgi:hypothetical protein